MAKQQQRDLFSRHFRVDPEHLDRFGAFDPALNVDTNLFINPLLLARSHATHMQAAWRHYRQWFEELGCLLKQCQEEDDAYWKSAYKLLHFKEPPSTCLGRTVKGTRGSGIGPVLASELVRSAYALVKLGTSEEELMVCLPFLCKGLGPDRISDMVTQIIMPDLASYTQSALDGLDLSRKRLQIGSDSYQVPQYQDKPVLLVPSDVLAEIKIVRTVRTIVEIAKSNKALRKRLNKHLNRMIRVGAQAVDDPIPLAPADQEAIAAFCEQLDRATLPYDWEADPGGHRTWHSALTIARRHPLPIQASNDPASQARLVVEQFGILLKGPAMARLLYLDARSRMPRPERDLRRLFFAIATTYCETDRDMLVEYDLDSGLTAFLCKGATVLTVDVASSIQTNWKDRYRTGAHCGRIFVFVNFGGKKKKAAVCALMNERRQRKWPAAEVQVFKPGSASATGTIASVVKGLLVKCPRCDDELLAKNLSRHERKCRGKHPGFIARR